MIMGLCNFSSPYSMAKEVKIMLVQDNSLNVTTPSCRDNLLVLKGSQNFFKFVLKKIPRYSLDMTSECSRDPPRPTVATTLQYNTENHTPNNAFPSPSIHVIHKCVFTVSPSLICINFSWIFPKYTWIAISS